MEQYLNNTDDNAIVDDKTIYNTRIKPTVAPSVATGIDENDIVSRIAEEGDVSQIDLNTLNSFLQISQSRDQLYNLIDEMSQDPTIAAILETYAEDATEYNDKGKIVWAESQDSKILGFVSWLLETLQVDKHIYKWVYNLCKYGDIYVQTFRESDIDSDPFFNEKEKSNLTEDVNIIAYGKNDKLAHYVDMNSNPAEVFELTRFGKTSGFIKAPLSANMVKQQDNVLLGVSIFNQYKFQKKDIDLYEPTKFIHATLEDDSSRYSEEVELFKDDKSYAEDSGTKYKVRRGQSLLTNVFKIWRELSLLENSILLNRITKSAIVRLINVEVGDMPKEDVGPHLQRIKQMMEQKSALNVGKSMNEYTNPGPIENNIYIPTYNGKGAITADQVGGDVNVGQLPDIDYFQNKFFGSMRIPKQYFGLTDDSAGFSGGQSLAIISSRYAKMIKRIQNSILQALTDLVNLMLIDKGLDSYIGKFKLCMQPPTTQEEIDRRDNLSSKVGIIGDIMNQLSEVEDPIIKLKILKSLMSSVTDNEVISLLDEQIKKLDGEDEETESQESEDIETADDLFGTSEPSTSSTSLDLDSQLDLGTEFESEPEEMTTEESTLPTPEEIGVDMTETEPSSEE